MTVTIPTLPLAGGGAMPVYGLGTWGIGGWSTADASDDARGVAAIRSALEAGVTHIDTAEMYGAGHAEELVGAAIRGFDRSRLFLASKALAHHLAHRELLAAAEHSLRRLATDYIDLYMIHHPSDGIPIEETLGAMQQLLERGWVRAIGVSNFSRARLQAAQAVSPAPIAVNQVHYSLSVREPETSGLLAHCRQTGVVLVAWQPLDPRLFEPAPIPVLDEVAARTGCRRSQLAIAWLLSQPGVAVVSRTRSPEHLRENLAALGCRLAPRDLEWLRAAYPGKRVRSPVFGLA